MKFLTKLIAFFLIAWLPVLGYPMTGSVCPEMSFARAVSPQHQNIGSMSGMAHNTKIAKATTSGTHITCHGDMGALSCGMPFLASRQITMTSTVSLSVYRPMNRIQAAQFTPQPPHRPPRAL
jgi:hypothetical protein